METTIQAQIMLSHIKLPETERLWVEVVPEGSNIVDAT